MAHLSELHVGPRLWLNRPSTLTPETHSESHIYVLYSVTEEKIKTTEKTSSSAVRESGGFMYVTGRHLSNKLPDQQHMPSHRPGVGL